MTSYLDFLQPAKVCQGFFVLSTAAGLGLALLPSHIAKLLLDYGPRSNVGEGDPGKKKSHVSHHSSGLVQLVKRILSMSDVPHAWFISFYAISVACSVLWAAQFLSGGRLLLAVASSEAANSAPSMTLAQVEVLWALMLLQGARRLYECLFVMRPSASTMGLAHWLLGLVYYVFMSVAVWVEGSEAILTAHGQPTPVSLAVLPSTTLTAIPVFFAGWVGQYWSHKHLAGLRKYTLSDRGLFRYLLCPHYTCECLMYLSFVFAAAPPSMFYNQTLLSAFMFVAANLGVTAHSTQEWSIGKFGQERVLKKWKMVPFIF